jgi:hypothetical protein
VPGALGYRAFPIESGFRRSRTRNFGSRPVNATRTRPALCSLGGRAQHAPHAPLLRSDPVDFTDGSHPVDFIYEELQRISYRRVAERV